MLRCRRHAVQSSVNVQALNAGPVLPKMRYLWDMHEKRLCSQCRTEYHSFKYNTCYKYLPASKKEELVGYREFAAEMDAKIKSLEEAYDLDSPTLA